LDDFYRSPVLLKHADYTLRAGLIAAGYDELSYYSVPDGFALISRLEKIETDGSPKPEPGRWSQADKKSGFSLGEYLSILFTAPAGRYRIIVFIVTPKPFAATGAKVSKAVAEEWVRSGSNQLPASLGGLPYLDQYVCTALIYEFEKNDSKDSATALVPGNLTAAMHLKNTGLGEFVP
jgi:hypothetical protein